MNVEHGYELRQESIALEQPQTQGPRGASSPANRGAVGTLCLVFTEELALVQVCSLLLRLRSHAHSHSVTWVKSIFSFPQSMPAIENPVSAVSKTDLNLSPSPPLSPLTTLVQATSIQQPPSWSLESPTEHGDADGIPSRPASSPAPPAAPSPRDVSGPPTF